MVTNLSFCISLEMITRQQKLFQYTNIIDERGTQAGVTQIYNSISQVKARILS